jgi:hypothetical protein
LFFSFAACLAVVDLILNLGVIMNKNENEQPENIPVIYVAVVCIALAMVAVTFYVVANCVGGCR